MALAASTTIYQVQASATTGNVNGSLFNRANANGFTDLTTDSNTGNTASPVVSSASYNFVAGDVGARVFISAGTDWVVGWYTIASVAANKATLSAAIGAADLLDTAFYPHKYSLNTSAGCATVGTPTGGSFLIDYTQQDTAQATNTNLTCTAGSTTVTSASAPFTRMMVGNGFHITAQTGGGGLPGWYEIVSFTDTSNVVLDRSPASGTNITAATFYVGGAGRLNGVEDGFLESFANGSYCHVKSGTYAISGTVSVSTGGGIANNQCWIIGYTSTRGDTCNGTSQPILTLAANAFTNGGRVNWVNMTWTTTTAAGITGGTGSKFINCRGFNTSTTTTRVALTLGSNGDVEGGEYVSQNGTAVVFTSQSRNFGAYIHDSSTGCSSSGTDVKFLQSLFQACDVNAVLLSSVNSYGTFLNVTVFGNTAKNNTAGISISSASNTGNHVHNSIVGGYVTGITVNTSSQTNHAFHNNFYGNTTDTTNFPKSNTDLALDPGFTDVSEITGSTATTLGSVLTQSGGDFSTVEDNVDYLHVISGVGVTTGIYLITSHTSTTVTVNNALGTAVLGDVIYYIPTGHNLTPGTNMKAAAYPGLFAGTSLTSYLDIGAVQRVEPVAGGGGGSGVIPVGQGSPWIIGH